MDLYHILILLCELFDDESHWFVDQPQKQACVRAYQERSTVKNLSAEGLYNLSASGQRQVSCALCEADNSSIHTLICD